jgi:hypothetical protein
LPFGSGRCCRTPSWSPHRLPKDQSKTISTQPPLRRLKLNVSLAFCLLFSPQSCKARSGQGIELIV